MSDVQKCDACGSIRFRHNSEYELAPRVADPDTSEDAIDVRQSGHLCHDCARKVAQLIKDIHCGDD